MRLLRIDLKEKTVYVFDNRTCLATYQIDTIDNLGDPQVLENLEGIRVQTYESLH